MKSGIERLPARTVELVVASARCDPMRPENGSASLHGPADRSGRSHLCACLGLDELLNGVDAGQPVMMIGTA